MHWHDMTWHDIRMMMCVLFLQEVEMCILVFFFFLVLPWWWKCQPNKVVGSLLTALVREFVSQRSYYCTDNVEYGNTLIEYCYYWFDGRDGVMDNCFRKFYLVIITSFFTMVVRLSIPYYTYVLTTTHIISSKNRQTYILTTGTYVQMKKIILFQKI